jgi:hypothetical protein
LLRVAQRQVMMKKFLMFSTLLALVLATSPGCAGDGDSPTEPSPVCSYTIAPGNRAFGSEGGTADVSVTTAQACTWTTAGAPDWITVTAGGTGSGPGTVAYAVAANGATTARNATLTIGGQAHAVVQEGRAPTVCTYTISPDSAAYNKDAATGTFAVAAPESCGWSATSSASWLTVTSGAQGSGPGTVAYAVARSVDTAERSGSITVAGRAFTVRQSGDGGACTYAVAPVAFQPCMPAGTLSATITTQASCPWTAASDSQWLAVASSASGNGAAVISMRYSDNYDAPRSGIVMVRWPTPTAGQNIHVAQAGCTYAVSRSDISMGAAGGVATFDVIQQSVPNTCGGATQDRCVWTAQADVPWITITSSMPRSGDNPVAFAVTAHDGTTPRVGRITVRDKTVVVTQSGR